MKAALAGNKEMTQNEGEVIVGDAKPMECGTASGKLGSGSYASVIKYEHEGEELALKRYSTPIDTGLSSCFREIEILSSLDHPHIIKYMGHYTGLAPPDPDLPKGEEDGQLHILMELAENNLSSVIKSHSRSSTHHRIGLEESLVKKYAAEILLGLEYLHYSQVIHRDLSCNNILVMKDGRLTICDFGMSKYFLSSIEPNDLYVNPDYRAPEMYAQSWYDFRVDIWSVGVIIQMMLLGLNPFSVPPKLANENNIQTIGRIISHIPRCPPDLSKWLGKCGLKLEGSLERRLRDREKGTKQPYCAQLSEEIRTFLARALCFHIKHRATASQLLDDPWLDSEREYITSTRRRHLTTSALENIRNPPTLIFPPSEIRDRLKEFILTLGEDQFGPRRGEGRVNRICLSLSLMYRILARSDPIIRSDMEQGYLLPLYLVCLIISIKYYSTNTVAVHRRIVPRAMRKYCTVDYLRTRELLILEMINWRIYTKTSYDISLEEGIIFLESNRESLWEYYTSSRAGRHDVEGEMRQILRQHLGPK